jgi:hypothetical protein
MSGMFRPMRLPNSRGRRVFAPLQIPPPRLGPFRSSDLTDLRDPDALRYYRATARMSSLVAGVAHQRRRTGSTTRRACSREAANHGEIVR